MGKTTPNQGDESTIASSLAASGAGVRSGSPSSTTSSQRTTRPRTGPTSPTPPTNISSPQPANRRPSQDLLERAGNITRMHQQLQQQASENKLPLSRDRSADSNKLETSKIAVAVTEPQVLVAIQALRSEVQLMHAEQVQERTRSPPAPVQREVLNQAAMQRLGIPEDEAVVWPSSPEAKKRNSIPRAGSSDIARSRSLIVPTADMSRGSSALTASSKIPASGFVSPLFRSREGLNLRTGNLSPR